MCLTVGSCISMSNLASVDTNRSRHLASRRYRISQKEVWDDTCDFSLNSCVISFGRSMGRQGLCAVSSARIPSRSVHSDCLQALTCYTFHFAGSENLTTFLGLMSSMTISGCFNTILYATCSPGPHLVILELNKRTRTLNSSESSACGTRSFAQSRFVNLSAILLCDHLLCFAQLAHRSFYF